MVNHLYLKGSKIILFFLFCFCSLPGFSQISERQERNLTAFAKLYGYVNYFHPSDEARKLDWQVLAIYGSNLMMNVKSDQELITSLKGIFGPIAPTVKIFQSGNPEQFSLAELLPAETKKFKVIFWEHRGLQLPGNDNSYLSYRTNRSPDNKFGFLPHKNEKIDFNKALSKDVLHIGDYAKKQIAEGIYCIVPLALYGDDQYTYPKVDSVITDSFIKKINASLPKDKNGKLDISGNVLEIRVADIVIAFNVLQHSFPYWEDASASSGTVLHNALTKAFSDRTSLDFLHTLQLMSVPLNDGHMMIDMSPDKADTMNIAAAPVILAKVDNDIVVKKILSQHLLELISVGDIIDSVDGRPAIKKLVSREEYISGSPQWKEYKALISLTNGSPGTIVKLSVRHKAGNKNVSIQRSISATGYRSGSFLEKIRESGWINPSTLYFNLTRDTISHEMMKNMANAKAIIFDLRGYPVSDAATDVLAHLIDKPDRTKWMHVPHLLYPDHEKITYQDYGWGLRPAAPRFTKKVYYLTDASSMSYSESLLGYVKDFKLATIVGQPTAGTNGDINIIYLPGKYRFSYSGILVTDHSAGKHHLKGIRPDIVVNPTLKGIAEDKDEILEKALELSLLADM